MTRALVLAFVLLGGACPSSAPPPREIPRSSPPPTDSLPVAGPSSTDATACPKPAETVDEKLLRGDGPMTKDECACAGGRFNASIGGGNQPHCAQSETELGPVRMGIEGGWCCKKS